ncbi:MAG: filamentous hemagglutinin N-terminal domain-containing protein [Cyanobacteria bacterium P01_G01_bin.54]
MPKHFTVAFRLVLAMIPWTFCSIQVAQAQVTSDGTLSTGVSNTGSDYTIMGGTTSGTNLFHSFDQFSVPTGGSATFNNGPAIQNIFSRVTGGTVSDIDGAINASGTANLFLINPAGIRFGENATLNIGGSFFAATADGIRFDNGVVFGQSTAAAPLLTVNSPVGLDFGAGNGTGEIRVSGPGHSLSYASPTNNPFAPVATPTLAALNPTIPDYVHGGLRVNPGNTLALIGSAVTLDGGLVTAERGRIEVGAVTAGQVDLSQSSPTIWSVSYANATTDGAVNFHNRALTDVSDDVLGVLGGLGGGSMQLVGGEVNLREGSIVLNQTVGVVPGGEMTVTANSLNLVEPDSATLFFSQILTETLDTEGFGTSSAITVAAGDLVQETGNILTRSFGAADSGEISIRVTDSIQLTAASSGIFSQISSRSGGAGRAGDVGVTATRLSVLSGSNVSSVIFGAGDAGNVTVTVADIDLVGAEPVTLSQSALSSATLGTGASGNLTVNTARLRVIDGGRVDAATVGPGGGEGGSVTINAADFVEVTGSVQGTGAIVGFSVPSQIIAGADVISLTLQAVLGLPPELPTGDSGNVTIRTPRLSVAEEGLVTVSNEGTGNGGTLNVVADQLQLREQGGLTASTLSGEGGNINLKLNSVLLMRTGSLISAEAGGTGNGGNISIDVPFLVAVPGENSDIIANAFQGNGGNINIMATGILGLEFRDQLTEFSDITASSQFGVSGTVTITNPNTTLTGLDAELQGDVLDPDQEVTQGCDAVGNSRFVATGRGGVPENPLNPRPGNSTWSDVRDLAAFRQTSPTTISQAPELPVIIEATGIRRNEKGELELYAEIAFSTPRIASIACTSTFRNN